MAPEQSFGSRDVQKQIVTMPERCEFFGGRSTLAIVKGLFMQTFALTYSYCYPYRKTGSRRRTRTDYDVPWVQKALTWNVPTSRLRGFLNEFLCKYGGGTGIRTTGPHLPA